MLAWSPFGPAPPIALLVALAACACGLAHRLPRDIEESRPASVSG